MESGRKSTKTAENADVWFWSRTSKTESGCIEWRGMIKDGRYGVVKRVFGRPYVYAHRISFFLTHGRWPKGVTRHKCDNKKCVNPLHLDEGTHLQNIQDAVDRGMTAHGEKSGSAVLTRELVRSMRRSNETNKEIADRLGVSDSTVSRARRGITWSRLVS